MTETPKIKRGLYPKYLVRRYLDPDPEQQAKAEAKHQNCDYFVLDLTHDAHSRVALIAYAESVRGQNDVLAGELDEKIERLFATKSMPEIVPPQIEKQIPPHMRQATVIYSLMDVLLTRARFLTGTSGYRRKPKLQETGPIPRSLFGKRPEDVD